MYFTDYMLALNLIGSQTLHPNDYGDALIFPEHHHLSISMLARWCLMESQGNNHGYLYQICTKSLSFREISIKSKNVNVMVMIDEKSKDHQSHLNSSSVHTECLYKIGCQSTQ